MEQGNACHLGQASHHVFDPLKGLRDLVFVDQCIALNPLAVALQLCLSVFVGGIKHAAQSGQDKQA